MTAGLWAAFFYWTFDKVRRPGKGGGRKEGKCYTYCGTAGLSPEGKRSGAPLGNEGKGEKGASWGEYTYRRVLRERGRENERGMRYWRRAKHHTSSLYGGTEEEEMSPSASPKVGAHAPDFSLPAVDGTTVRLADYRNQQHVVLVFLRGFF